MNLDKLAKLKSKKFVIIIVLITIFIGAAIFVYNKYVAPKLNPTFIENREFTNTSLKSNDATLYFIYATWCPHSKKVIKQTKKSIKTMPLCYCYCFGTPPSLKTKSESDGSQNT